MDKKTFILLFTAVLAVNFTGLFCDIFTQDSALYAYISKQFSVTNDYINIYVDSKDWLDKPHFPFWVCGLFMEVLGTTTFAYKLPSFVFFIIGLVYTFKLAKQLYSTQVAYFATLIMSSGLHLILSNNDVRAECILLGLVVATTYYLYNLKLDFSFKNLILAALFGGASVMTKGIFALIIPYSAVGLDIISRGQIKENISIRWILVGLLTVVCFLPEVYSVYVQFDLHPEKIVFDRQNVSGVKFMFWDSQFGRFFNTGPIKGRGDKFFFFHNTLWAFAPWAIMGFVSLGLTVKRLFSKEKSKELVTFFGFITMFALFSMSRFQLPHYTNIIFPFLSIIIAAAIVNFDRKWFRKLLQYSVNLYCLAFLAAIVFVEYSFCPDSMLLGIIAFVSILALLVYTNTNKPTYNHKHFVLGVLSIALFLLYLNLSFLPKVLSYQAGPQMARYINKHHPDEEVLSGYYNWLFEYYADGDIVHIEDIDDLKSEMGDESRILMADKCIYDDLIVYGVDFEVIKEFAEYRITKLKPKFINHKTREATLNYDYLIRVNPNRVNLNIDDKNIHHSRK